MKSIKKTTPVISIVVVVYDMNPQALNTLFSLTEHYQNFNKDLYEVIVVENKSQDILDKIRVISLGDQFHYHLRNETSVSPVFAANFGLSQCRGQYIGMMIDGARILTPGVLANVINCFTADSNALCLIPGYELESPAKKEGVDFSQQSEQEWLGEISWEKDGYQLFENAIPSPGNRTGYLNPLMECNCLFAHRQYFERIGGLDENFTLPGGGSINLHLLRQLGMQPEVRPVVLAGEGSFHQAHGGVTTSDSTDKKALIASFKAQLDQAWGGNFYALRKEPKLLGKIGSSALPAFEYSCIQSINRFKKLKSENREDWEDELPLTSARLTRNGSKPILSVLVMSNEIPGQFDNTQHCLSASYQKGVRDDEYELIDVETSSIKELEYKISLAKGEYLGLIADGESLLTPGIISHALDCIAMFEAPLVTMPGYNISEGMGETVIDLKTKAEGKQLKHIDWKVNGYRLFEIARFSAENRYGFLQHFLACSVLFCRKASLKKIIGANRCFTFTDDGRFIMHLHKQSDLLTEMQWIVFPGEGSFHKSQWSLPAPKVTDRNINKPIFQKLKSLWKGKDYDLARGPFIYGNIPKQALPFLLASIKERQLSSMLERQNS